MTSLEPPFRLIAPDVKLGRAVRVHGFTNLYGCEVGDESRIGTFVEIQKGARIGARCKVSSHTFICEGVTIEDDVFIGHNVTFINDRFPRATNDHGLPQTEADWECLRTIVRRGASIGSGATLLGGITVGEDALIGAGSVVTSDVPPGTVVAGNPARILRTLPCPTRNGAASPLEAHFLEEHWRIFAPRAADLLHGAPAACEIHGMMGPDDHGAAQPKPVCLSPQEA